MLKTYFKYKLYMYMFMQWWSQKNFMMVGKLNIYKQN